MKKRPTSQLATKLQIFVQQISQFELQIVNLVLCKQSKFSQCASMLQQDVCMFSRVVDGCTKTFRDFDYLRVCDIVSSTGASTVC